MIRYVPSGDYDDNFRLFIKDMQKVNGVKSYTEFESRWKMNTKAKKELIEILACNEMGVTYLGRELLTARDTDELVKELNNFVKRYNVIPKIGN